MNTSKDEFFKLIADDISEKKFEMDLIILLSDILKKGNRYIEKYYVLENNVTKTVTIKNSKKNNILRKIVNIPRYINVDSHLTIANNQVITIRFEIKYIDGNTVNVLKSFGLDLFIKYENEIVFYIYPDKNINDKYNLIKRVSLIKNYIENKYSLFLEKVEPEKIMSWIYTTESFKLDESIRKNITKKIIGRNL